MSRRAAGIALIAVAATLWGTWPLYTRAGGPTGVSLGFLCLLAMALPAPFVFRRAAFADRGAVIALVLVGLADAANVILYFVALERGPVVVAVLSHYLAPTLVALTAPFILKEPRSRRALLASPIALIGLALVLSPGGTSTSSLNTALLGGGSAIFYAIVVLGSRRAARSFSPGAVMSLHAVISAGALLLVFGREVIPTQVNAELGIVLFGCLVNGMIAGLLFNLSLERLEAQLVGLFTYLEPINAAILGAAVLGELFGLTSVVGLILVVLAGAWGSGRPAEADGLSRAAAR